MAAVDDPKTLGRTRLSFASEADIDEFVQTLERFERGELAPDQWRAFRLVRGTYGQRQTTDSQMLRVKVPQGVLTARQLHALADVSEQYSRGFGHITTRQNLQFHFIKLHDVELAMRTLADTGLTTREACGNSVRNITACPYAGVAADEAFDVTPYAEALTRYLLRHPLSSTLPRKFKIAFEGCPEDHAATGINDIGWRARLGPGGARGFHVTIGGGTATMTRAGRLLYDFLPANHILEVAEAIIRVFARFGDYQHKQRNRMKFLIKTLGWDHWREEYERALEEFRAEGGAALPFDPEHPGVEDAPDWPQPEPITSLEVAARVTAATVQGPGLQPDVRPLLQVTTDAFHDWLRTNVRLQKQAGYAIAVATLPLGDITGAQLRVAAELATAYGDGSVRVTTEQNLVFRWIRLSDVRDLYERLAAAGVGLAGAGTAADVTSCPGAESCRLAVTQSRGLGRMLESYVRERPQLGAAASDLNIKISGCPNGCGQHHVATVGFQGSIRKLGDRVIPQYFVMVGGGADAEGARFGRLAAKIPARRAALALERLVALYERQADPGEEASTFFQRLDVSVVRAEIADLERLTPDDVVPADFIDLGEQEEYRPEVMDGECSA
jgi:sulfite reductase beta subunit-like hemoprotein